MQPPMSKSYEDQRIAADIVKDAGSQGPFMIRQGSSSLCLLGTFEKAYLCGTHRS